MLCIWGVSPGCRLFSTLYVAVGEKTPPTTHRGAVRKYGAEIPRGWSRPECFTSLGGLERPPLFLIIQWRRQRLFTWSTILWAEILIPGNVSTAAPFYWNKLPNIIRNAQSFSSFKTLLHDWVPSCKCGSCLQCNIINRWNMFIISFYHKYFICIKSYHT